MAPSGPAQLDHARAARALEAVGERRVARRDDDLASLDRAEHAHECVEAVRVPVGEQLVEEHRQPRLGVDRIDEREPHRDVDLLERAARERRADAHRHRLARAGDLQHGLAAGRLDDRDRRVAAVRDRLQVAAGRLQPGRRIALAHLALGPAHDGGGQHEPVALALDGCQLGLDRLQLALDVADRPHARQTGELGAQLLLAQHQLLGACACRAQLGDQVRVLVVREHEALAAGLALARRREQRIQLGHALDEAVLALIGGHPARAGSVQPLERVGLLAGGRGAADQALELAQELGELCCPLARRARAGLELGEPLARGGGLRVASLRRLELAREAVGVVGAEHRCERRAALGRAQLALLELRQTARRERVLARDDPQLLDVADERLIGMRDA